MIYEKVLKMSDYIIHLTSEQERALLIHNIDIYEYISNIMNNKANECVKSCLKLVSEDNQKYLTDVQIGEINNMLQEENKSICNVEDLPDNIKYKIVREMKHFNISKI